ncbi:MAG: hypothetical protein R6U32_02995 [Candidatus Woesearchaeota archaeon]
MAEGDIDWEACYEFMRRVSMGVTPKVAEFQRGLDLETNLRSEITLQNFPPRIEISFAPDGHLQNREYLNKQQEIADFVASTAEEYSLKAHKGFYLNKKGKKREFVKSQYHYTLKPDYEEFRECDGAVDSRSETQNQ